jgi:hypothetical protein
MPNPTEMNWGLLFSNGQWSGLFTIFVAHLGGVIVYASVMSGIHMPVRIGALSLAASACVCARALHQIEHAAWIIGAYGYFLLVSCAVYAARDVLREGWTSPAAAFVLLTFVYVVLPGIALGSEAVDAFVVPGWMFALAAYSYLVDNRALRPGLHSALFFILVDPTVVAGQTMRVQEREPWRVHLGSLCRIALALAAIAGVSALHRVLLVIVPGAFTEMHPALESAAEATCFAAIWLITTYLIHAARARMQIAALRPLGYIVPECYVRPWAARSPSDFWRRWNIWVTNWTELYLFRPVCRRLRGFWPRSSKRSLGLSIILTLCGMGAYHDLLPLVVGRKLSVVSLQGFFLMGLAGLGWSIVLGRLGRLRRKRSFSASFQRFAFACTVLLVVALWGKR